MYLIDFIIDVVIKLLIKFVFYVLRQIIIKELRLRKLRELAEVWLVLERLYVRHVGELEVL